MTDLRAQTGGQIGINNEFYKGGQFLPSNKETEKGAKNSAKNNTSKQEIALYKWEIAPNGETSIWRKVSGFCEFNKTGYSKTEGATGTLEVCEYYNWTSEEEKNEVKAMAEKWNKGERWI